MQCSVFSNRCPGVRLREATVCCKLDERIYDRHRCRIGLARIACWNRRAVCRLQEAWFNIDPKAWRTFATIVSAIRSAVILQSWFKGLLDPRPVAPPKDSLVEDDRTTIKAIRNEAVQPQD